MPRILTLSTLLLASSFLVVHAQEERPTAAAVPLPVGIASDDHAFALDANPSLLAYVPRYSVVIAHSREGVLSLDHAGTSLYAAVASPSRFGFGLGVDRRDDAVFGARTRLSIAAALCITRGLSLGIAYRVLGADGAVDGVSSVDVALTYRPSARLSLAVVGHDLLAPLDLARASGRELPASFYVAAGFRPFATDSFTTELAFGADTDGVLRGRLYGAVRILNIGRAFVVGTVDDLTGGARGSLLAGLEFRIGGIAAGGGVLSREAPGGEGFLAYASVDGRVPGGLVPRDRLVDLEITSGPSVRTLAMRLLALERALRDPHVDGVVLHLRDTDLGLADAQELRHVIAQLVAADRPVTCVLESPSGSELYACSAATEIHVEPAGTVRLVGPSVALSAYGGLLTRLGIHADFVRIGAYKTAPERFLLDRPSDEAIAQTSQFVDDAYSRMVQDFAADLGVSREVVLHAVDEGPLTPDRAVAIGLVDDAIDAHDLEAALERLHGRSLPLDGTGEVPLEPGFGARARVAVVLIDGPIVDRASVVLPVLGTLATGADTIVATLERLEHDPSVAAVVLRVDSPGGSAVASDRIFRAARRLGERKPLIASLGGVAASGGYYVAAAARTIYADPTTLTGSIGVYYGKIDVAPLAERLGVGLAFVERGAHAGATSVFRPFDSAEREHLQALVQSSYELFLARVAEGRGRTVESLEGLGEGRIFSGDRARELGLVDRLGGLVAAVRHARVLAHLDADAPVLVLPEAHVGLLERLAFGTTQGAAPSPAVRSLAWLAFAPTEGMMALAPLDRGAR